MRLIALSHEEPRSQWRRGRYRDPLDTDCGSRSATIRPGRRLDPCLRSRGRLARYRRKRQYRPPVRLRRSSGRRYGACRNSARCATIQPAPGWASSNGQLRPGRARLDRHLFRDIDRTTGVGSPLRCPDAKPLEERSQSAARRQHGAPVDTQRRLRSRATGRLRRRRGDVAGGPPLPVGALRME